MPLEVFTLIMTVIVFIVALFLIPLLLQLRSTVQRMDELARDVQRDLVPMLKDLRETSEHLKRTSAAAEKGSEIFNSLSGTAAAIEEVNHFIRHDVGRLMGNLVGFWTGVKAAGKSLAEQAETSERRS